MTKLIRLGMLMLCLVSFAFQSFAQNVKGKVTTKDGEPIIGASVVLQGKFVGTTTNVKGEFGLNLNFDSNPLVLEISFLGFETQKITLSAPSTTLNIKLEEKILAFGEVIVSASRVEERILEAPVTVTKVSSKQLLNSGGTDLYANLSK